MTTRNRKSITFKAMKNPVAESLVSWYSVNKRHLPWRETRDPYLIWLSEVILQQTRVNQGLEYYRRFVEAFPVVFDLAGAAETEVLKLWQGLGYYSRARNLHKTAKIIVGNHSGKFPETSSGLLKLPGIGNYTAAAIASICFDEAAPVVDGNVIRVVSRLFGIAENAQTPGGYKQIAHIMHELMEGFAPSLFNQAVMEFGALQCVPNSPACHQCSLQPQCFAFANGLVQQLPVKKSKPEVTVRYFNYLVITITKADGDCILLRKRTGKDIWHNLYDFPAVENSRELITDQDLTSSDAGNLLPTDFSILGISGRYTHLLTHRRIIAKFFRIHISSEMAPMQNHYWVKVADLPGYPVPRLIDRYLHEHPVSTLVIQHRMKQ